MIPSTFSEINQAVIPRAPLSPIRRNITAMSTYPAADIDVFLPLST
ncbi:MAG: hypothetical protein ACKVK3_03330 [Acidimicrobiales bacterium]